MVIAANNGKGECRTEEAVLITVSLQYETTGFVKTRHRAHIRFVRFFLTSLFAAK